MISGGSQGAFRNYAGISVKANGSATVVPLVNSWKKIDVFDAASPERISNGVHASGHVIVGATGVYQVSFDSAADSAGANKTYELSAFEIDLANPVTITVATDDDPVVITAIAHGLSNGDFVKINGGDMVELTDRIFRVADKTDNTFELQDDAGSPADIDGGAFTTYTTGGLVYAAVETAVHSLRRFAGSSDVGYHGASCHVSLTGASSVELYVKGTSDATDITVDTANLNINRVG